MENSNINGGYVNGNGKYSNGYHARSNTAGKVITCKAAVVWGAGEPFVMEEVEVDPPKRMEVRVKILFTSICHSDLSAWLGLNEAQRAYPRIFGHEASGVVESVGEGVDDLKEGDHVIPIFNGECKTCIYCKSDKTNLCGDFRVNPFKSVMKTDGKTRFFVKDKANGERRPIYHFLNTSTFSEYTVLDSACAVKIDSKAPLHKMCLLSCGISTGVGAAWNTANVQEGSTVAIFGLGAVGLAVAEGARLRGASRIIGVDINAQKFVKAKEWGVTDFVNPKDCDKPVHEVIMEINKGGVDFSFECAGNLDVLREAFLSTHDGWGLTVVLGIHTSPKLLPLHPMELFDGRRIIGCTFGDFKGKSQLPDFADKCMSGEIRINFEGFITHELPFGEINQAFELLQQGKSLRLVFCTGTISEISQFSCILQVSTIPMHLSELQLVTRIARNLRFKLTGKDWYQFKANIRGYHHKIPRVLVSIRSPRFRCIFRNCNWSPGLPGISVLSLQGKIGKAELRLT